MGSSDSSVLCCIVWAIGKVHCCDESFMFMMILIVYTHLVSGFQAEVKKKMSEGVQAVKLSSDKPYNCL